MEAQKIQPPPLPRDERVAPSQLDPSTAAGTPALRVRPSLRVILVGMWLVAALAVGGVGAAVWLLRDRSAAPAVRFTPAADDAAAPLPVLFDAPPFTLTDQDGRPFGSDRLRGHVWVADFVFTHCTSFCPLMTSSMAAFQQQSAAAGMADVRMASFTVDPDRDTPPVLKAYAAANGADLARWAFLTGTQKQMWDLSAGMKLSVGPGDTLGGPAGMQVMHSSHFLLIDQKGHVRGVYDFKDAAYLKQLLSDAKRILSEGGTPP